MTRARGIVLLVLAALVCCVAGLLLPASAGAARSTAVQISLGGRPFTDQPVGSLFESTALAPGSALTGVLGVRNGLDGAAELRLQFDAVHDDDAGCTARERPVDRTCGAGQGDLGAALRYTISTSGSRGGVFATTWTGTTQQLRKGVVLGRAVASTGQRWVRLTATLPASAGEAVETDTLRFGVRIVLAEVGGSGTGSVHVGGLGTGGESASHGSSPLAFTGVSVALLIGGAALLLGAGGLALRAGAVRRRPVAG